MTSSLVGSEMCIRDRATAPLALSLADAGVAGRRRERGASNHCWNCDVSSCLLYTSDAADDM
eukprot:2919839-Prorocentrum_lima.AAC.1